MVRKNMVDVDIVDVLVIFVFIYLIIKSIIYFIFSNSCISLSFFECLNPFNGLLLLFCFCIIIEYIRWVIEV